MQVSPSSLAEKMAAEEAGTTALEQENAEDRAALASILAAAQREADVPGEGAWSCFDSGHFG